METWVDLAVRVPSARVGEFYEVFGRWLQTGDPTATVGVTTVRAAGSSAKRDDAWRTGAEADRTRDAQALYRQISPAARRILDYWLDRNGERVRADDMARDLGMASTNTIAGTLSSFSKQGGMESKRGLPFHWEKTHDGTWYWVEPDVAVLFEGVRRAFNR